MFQSGIQSISGHSLVLAENKRVLVTGGAGYIGSHTVLELLNAGYEVVVVDNFSNSSLESLARVCELTGKTLDLHQVDILDNQGLFEVFEKYFDSEAQICYIDAVVHFAGLKAVGESVKDPLEYYHVNLTGTMTLLKMMEIFGVDRIVFSSSATVYGNCPTIPIDEECPTAALSPYGATKLFAERIIADFIRKVNGKATVLRYFNPVGAHPSGRIGEHPKGVPNNLAPFLAQVAVGLHPKVYVYGTDYFTYDGTGVRDYIHIMDLAHGHLLALEKMETLVEKGESRVYNLGTGRGYSVLDVIKAFSRACGREIPYELTGRRDGDVPTLIADVEKARRELGFESRYGLDEMCEHLWNWQSLNPNGYDANGKHILH
jgi:UDP-glucose 4-epimerase